ncbi:unnamed protein product [Diamesa serratosioi]
MMLQDEEVKKKKKVKKVDPYACKHGKNRPKSTIPYEQICQQRYHNSVKMHNEQFMNELKCLEAMQPTAYDQTRFHRMFAITTLWPPLHTRKEIEYTINVLYKSSQRHMRRVEEILKRNF